MANTTIETTTGQIAKQLGVPKYQIDYIVQTRNIDPVRRLGIVRLFDGNAQILMRKALTEIATQRANRADARNQLIEA